MKRPVSLCLALLLAVPVMSQSQAQEVMYRWVDDQGTVHYGQVPPSGIQAEQIRRGSGTPVDRVAQDRLQRQMEAQDERRQQARSEQDVQARQEESERIRGENCARARNNLETLTTRGGRVTIKENDQYRVMDEEERQAMIDETRGQIREYCGEQDP